MQIKIFYFFHEYQTQILCESLFHIRRKRHQFQHQSHQWADQFYQLFLFLSPLFFPHLPITITIIISPLLYYCVLHCISVQHALARYDHELSISMRFTALQKKRRRSRKKRSMTARYFFCRRRRSNSQRNAQYPSLDEHDDDDGICDSGTDRD